MNRCSPALIVAPLLFLGCSGQGPVGDGPPDITEPMVCCENLPEPKGGPDPIDLIDPTVVTEPGKIVTPTADISDQRAKVKEMDMAGLISALNDPTLATAATDELASRGDEAVKPLIDALDSGDTTVMQRAIFTLGQLGPAASDALPKLRELSENGSSEVIRDSAKFAIDAIQTK